MRTTVVRSDCLIDAYMSEGVLHVSQSTRLKERHRLYQPVKEAITHNCTALIGKATFDDEEWVGGSYTWQAIRVYDLCPGPTKDHECRTEVTRERVPVRIASESVRAMSSALQAGTTR